MKKEIYNLFKQESSKYTYFFLSITASIIAFLVKLALDKTPDINHKLLLPAMLLFSFSFFCGWRNILLYMQKLKYEFAIDDIEEKTKNPEIKTKAKDWVYRRLDENDKKFKRYTNWQFIFFVLGMLLFILLLTVKFCL